MPSVRSSMVLLLSAPLSSGPTSPRHGPDDPFSIVLQITKVNICIMKVVRPIRGRCRPDTRRRRHEEAALLSTFFRVAVARLPGRNWLVHVERTLLEALYLAANSRQSVRTLVW